MAAPTLQELRNRAKRRCDMVSSGFVSDAEWNDYLSESGSEFYDIILRADETALVKAVVIPLVAGQTLYNIPEDFYKVNAVFEQQSNNMLFDLDRMSAHDLANNWPDYVGFTRGSSVYRYYLENLSLQIRPVPTGGRSLLFKYIPQFTRFVDDLSPFGWPSANGWEEYIVIGACIKAFQKEGTMDQAQILISERARLEERIVRMASSKDNFSPRRIRDVYGITGSLYRTYLTQR